MPLFKIVPKVSFFLSEKLCNIIEKHIEKAARIAGHRCKHSYKDQRFGFFSLEKEAMKGDTRGVYEIVEAMHKVKRSHCLKLSNKKATSLTIK